MTIGYQNQIYSNTPFRSNLASSAPLAKPIEVVQKTIEGTVDPIVDTKKSKKTRNAIAVGSSVLVLTGLVTLLNPKFSPKITKKLKDLTQKFSEKIEKSEDGTLTNKVYKTSKSAIEWTEKSLQFTNNFNSFKDSLFKQFCTEKKDFLRIKHKPTRNIVKKIDSGIVKVFKPAHEAITRFFDNISKKTVLSKYENSLKKMSSLEELINAQKCKLSDVEKLELEKKLNEIKTMKENFSKTQVQERLAAQEEAMQNLENDFWNRFRAYCNGFERKLKNNGEHIGKNMSCWTQDALQPIQDKIKVSGEQSVNKLIGEKGVYKEIIDILSPHISAEEKSVLQNQLNKTAKSLNKANKSECVGYFEKKRDLTLGGAPTDILTALFGLGMTGFAISKADNKDERISKLFTGVLPVVGGFGASMVFAAKLISGPVGMLAGAGTGALLNVIGSFANKHLLGNKEEPEVINA